MELEGKAMIGYSAFPKPPALPESHRQIVLCYNQDTRCGESYPSAEKQSVYSTSPVVWAVVLKDYISTPLKRGNDFFSDHKNAALWFQIVETD